MSALIYWHLEKSWSIQSVNTISEPKKEYGEVYKRGEMVKARFSGSTYPGMVVQVSSSRENLRNTVLLIDEITSSHSQGDLLPEELLQALRLKEKEAEKTTTRNEGTACSGKSKSISEKTSSKKKDMDKKTKQKDIRVPKTKAINDKKDAAKRKNEAAIRMSEEIVQGRRNEENEEIIHIDEHFHSRQPQNDDPYSFQAASSFVNDTVTVPPVYGAYQNLLYSNINSDELIQHTQSNQVMEVEPYAFYHNQPTYQNLQSTTTPQLQEIAKLQEEIKRIKEENAALREENKRLKRTMPESIQATPRKVKFLKELTSYLSETQRETTEGPENVEMPSLVHARRALDQTSEDVQPSCTPKKSPYHITKKVPLMADHQVYVTPRQMSYIKHKSTSARNCLLVLLDTLFSKETLAASSAKGTRKAINKGDDSISKPLDNDILASIKAYVVKEFKEDGGKPIMTDSQMNEIINAKCGSARRALKKNTRIV